MQSPRFGSRNRLSRHASELCRLATAIADAGGSLEIHFLEKKLHDLLEILIQANDEKSIVTALDKLFDTEEVAHGILIDQVESLAETTQLLVDDKAFDIQLFAAPVLSWSRYSIPSLPIPDATLNNLLVQLGAHVLSRHARLTVVDFLFSPDQLPRNFCDTGKLTRQLAPTAIKNTPFHLDAKNLSETAHFLSDTRYLVGAIAVPQGQAMFRWSEKNIAKEEVLQDWIRQGEPNFIQLLTGCARQMVLPDAYHNACRRAELLSRPYAIEAAVAFLQATLNILPDQLSAVIGSCYDQEIEECRISFGPKNSDDVFYGVVWPLLAEEEEDGDLFSQIDTALHAAGIKDIFHLTHRLPMEFCEDCNAPFFPNREGEMVHAGIPEQEGDNHASPTLH